MALVRQSPPRRNLLHPVWRLLWVAIWLVFLGYEVGDILSGSYSPARAALAWVALVAFATTYLVAMWIAVSMAPREPRGRRLAPYLLVIAMGVAFPVVFRGQWGGLIVYCCVASGWTLGRRALGPALLGLGGYLVIAGRLSGYAFADIAFLAFLSVALGFTMLGFRSVLRLVIELRSAREEIAQLAVADERLRLARDVHDVLGHSLSVIALKTQVAKRLLATEPDAAAEALDDVERVTQDSLREVRAIAGGLRQRSLAEELASARSVLAAAGIDVDVAGDPDAVTPRANPLFAWTVREGVTNVIRHSRANRCTISILPSAEATALEIADDGNGRHPDGDGSGLRGLRERASQLGARMEAGPIRDGGFRLWVSVPRRATASEC